MLHDFGRKLDRTVGIMNVKHSSGECLLHQRSKIAEIREFLGTDCCSGIEVGLEFAVQAATTGGRPSTKGQAADPMTLVLHQWRAD